MPARETAPVATTGAVQNDRLRDSRVYAPTSVRHAYSPSSFLVAYLSEFSDARSMLHGAEGVCVRFRGSPLEQGLCDLVGRVLSADRTGLVLATLQGVTDGEVDELVEFIPWRSVERVTVGFAADLLPEVAS